MTKEFIEKEIAGLEARATAIAREKDKWSGHNREFMRYAEIHSNIWDLIAYLRQHPNYTPPKPTQND